MYIRYIYVYCESNCIVGTAFLLTSSIHIFSNRRVKIDLTLLAATATYSLFTLTSNTHIFQNHQ